MKISFSPFLRDVVARTSLVDLGHPLLADFVGPDEFFKQLPAIPDVFVSNDSSTETGTESDDGTTTLLDAAQQAYLACFTPHIGVELRYNITQGMIELVKACSQNGWTLEKAVRRVAKKRRHQERSSAEAVDKKPCAMAWQRHTPLNSSVRRLCVLANTVKPVHRDKRACTGDVNFTFIATAPGKRKASSAPKVGATSAA
jgi:hypothetical protein